MQPSPPLGQLEQGLATAFPGLRIAPVMLLGSGFRSIVVRTLDDIVFKVARTAEAARGRRVERAVLIGLAGYLPVSVPEPRWYAPPSTYLLPHGAVGYRMLPGQPLPSGNTALEAQAVISDLASFLVTLHSFDRPSPDIPGPREVEEHYRAIREAVMPVLAARLTPTETRTLETWWSSFLGDEGMRAYSPVLSHRDLWHENILVEDDRVSGILDFEAAALADPAQDFVTLRHVSDEFAHAVLDRYQSLGGDVDARFEHRMKWLWELREFGGVASAISLADEAELDDAVRKLREGPIFGG